MKCYCSYTFVGQFYIDLGVLIDLFSGKYISLKRKKTLVTKLGTGFTIGKLALCMTVPCVRGAVGAGTLP